MTVDWEIHEATLINLAKRKSPKLSAQQIADIIGEPCTRMSVIGKARRLGISLTKVKTYRRPKRATTKKVAPKPRKKSYVSTPPKLLPEPDRTLFEPLDIDLMELDATTCRFPTVSPPTRGEHLFCGHTTEPGVLYCPHHMKEV